MTNELGTEQLDQLQNGELSDAHLEGVVGGKDGLIVGVGGRPGWGGGWGGPGWGGGGWGGGGWGGGGWGRPGWGGGGFGGGFGGGGRRFW